MLKKNILYFIVFLNFKLISLNSEEYKKIGNLICQNETSHLNNRLVFWHEHETFPSFGIGHFTWHPTGDPRPYSQQFPDLIKFFKKNNVSLPLWLDNADLGAPWKTREEFLQDKIKTAELCKILSNTINLQTQFMINQLEQQWPNILNSAPKNYKNKISKYYKLMLSTPQGSYALVDYLNFKGSGLNQQEERNGQRWGLLQVLIDMPNNLTEDNIKQAFTISAAKKLLMLIENTPPNYKLTRYLKGWMARLSTYSNPKLFS